MKTCLICLGLVSTVLFTVQAVPYPYPNPFPNPMANPLALSLAGPAPRPEANCCGGNGQCGIGLCNCCEGSKCENGACSPIISYKDGFYGPPRVAGGYGRTLSYGR